MDDVENFSIDPQYDLEQTELIPPALPQRTIKTQAATLSMLAGDNESGSQFFDSVSQISPELQKEMISNETNRIRASFKTYVADGLIGVLTDPNVDMDQKQAAVDGIRNGNLDNTETSEILMSNSLASPSDGETSYGESVRLMTADMTREVNSVIADRQSIVNMVKAARDTSTMSTVKDLFDSLLPAAPALALARAEGQLYQQGDSTSTAALSAMLLPGTTIAQAREKLISMPIGEQNEFFTKLKDAIIDNSGILTQDNQLQAIDLIGKIAADEYSSSEQFVDNIFNVLDLVGIGALFRSVGTIRRASKTTNTVAESAEAAASEVRPVQVTPDLSRQFSEPQVPNNVDKVADLEKQYEEVINLASRKLDEGSVSRMHQERDQITAALNQKVSVRSSTMANSELVRKENLQQQLGRIDQQLAADRQASAAQTRLATLEKEMAAARKTYELQPAGYNPIMDGVRRAQMQGVVTDINPRTPGWIINNTNPDIASNLHHMILTSTSDETAQALFGVSRNEALMQGLIPQVTSESRRIKSVPNDIEKTTRRFIGEQLGEPRYRVGGTQFTPKELASARSNIVNDYSSVFGAKLNTGMSNFAFDGDVVTVSGVYTNGESGWLRAQDAIDQMKFALKDRNVSDDALTVLKKDGDEYVPVKLSEVKDTQGDFAIRVDSSEIIKSKDIAEWEELDVKRNLLDRLFGGSVISDSFGSLNRHVFDPASTLHPTITGAASTGDDKISVLAHDLLEMASNFTDRYVRLPKGRQAHMYEYIKEANIKEIPFDRIDLQARRFSDNEIDMLKTWRDTWDSLYDLENADLVQTLRNQNYQWFENPNFQAAVKPVAKDINKARVYDPANDSMRTLDRAEMDVLYKNGGTFAEFRRPVTINGEVVEQMMVRQTPTEYSRALRDVDQILNKREGYYQISYRAPRFIDETYLDSAGISRTRTVGVAGTTDDAKSAIKLLKNRNPSSEFNFRRDERGIRRDSDAYWDLNQVGGRIAQRHRGKLLENAVGAELFGGADFIDNPVDSAVKAIMSISGRTAMRPVLEASKERFVRQYGHLLKVNETTRQPQFPRSSVDIQRRGDVTSKDLADARTTFEYINYLENGYINSIDNVVKNALHIMADGAARVGSSTLEKGLNSLADVSFTGGVKGSVFGAMIASNPLRQWIVQTNQVVRTMVYNPQGWLSGQIPTLVTQLTIAEAGGKVSGKGKDFVDFLKNTGMFQAVAKSNLVRDTLLDVSDRHNPIATATSQAVGSVFGRQAGQAVGHPVQTMRMIGFDVGEKANIAGHAAAVFDDYSRRGLNIRDAGVQAEMHAKVRNLTWNMNFAGDMPYNQNALGLVMTYMQVPHKALLQATNRGLTRAERLRLVTADMVLWGTPTALVATLVGHNMLPDDPEAREILVDGLQSAAINYSLSSIAGQKVNLDLSSLAPYDMDSWKDLMFGLFFDGGVSSVIDRSPAARVFGLDADSRTGMAIKMSAGFFKDMLEQPDLDRTTFLDVMDSFGKISSGWNNFQKARAMYTTALVRNKYGAVIEKDVHPFEAIGQALGFGPKSVRQYYETLVAASKDIKDFQEQGKKDAQEMMQMFVARNNGTFDDVEALEMFSQYYTTTSTIPGEDNKRKYLAGLISELQADANTEVMTSLAKYLGFEDPAAFKDRVRESPISEENKLILMEAFDEQTNFIKGMKE